MIVSHIADRSLASARWPLLWAIAISMLTRAAAGQAVQLPTFHFFSLSTTVSVPDGGDALLGGVSRSASGRVQRGIPGLPSQPFDNVVTGRATGTSNVSASATIHDFEAMDKALQESGVENQASVLTAPGSAGKRPIVSLPKLDGPVQSIAAIRAEQAAEDAARQQEAATALARGRQLLAEGKTNVARIYFQSAVKKSTDKSDIREQAIAALRSIEQPSDSGKLAGH
jgi:hypothetical protein